MNNNSLPKVMSLDDITPDVLPLDFVKQYLRVEHNLDDLEIALHIRSAQTYVRNYIKIPKDEPLDNDILIPVLSLIAHLYENKSVNTKSTEKLDMIFGSVLNLHRRDLL